MHDWGEAGEWRGRCRVQVKRVVLVSDASERPSRGNEIIS